jgi:hypothetical protein
MGDDADNRPKSAASLAAMAPKLAQEADKPTKRPRWLLTGDLTVVGHPVGVSLTGLPKSVSQTLLKAARIFSICSGSRWRTSKMACSPFGVQI